MNNADESRFARKRMKRNGMILAQCQRTKRGLVEIFVGDNTKKSPPEQPADATSFNMNSLHQQQYSCCFLNVIRTSRFKNHQHFCFWLYFLGVKTHGTSQLPITLQQWYHRPQERSMVPRPIGTGFQLLEDLYGKHRHCTKKSWDFFCWQVKRPSNQVLLTQLFQSQISQEPTGAGFDASLQRQTCNLIANRCYR